VTDAGCGLGGTFPYLIGAVGPLGEVVGVEISPEAAINARKRIEANHWKNVHLVVGDARMVQLAGMIVDAVTLLRQTRHPPVPLRHPAPPVAPVPCSGCSRRAPVRHKQSVPDKPTLV
jgi:ubiquinone/menaquinone biosynthesis C-methylase UbiE